MQCGYSLTVTVRVRAGTYIRRRPTALGAVGEPNALMRGAGLHRLTFPVTLDARNTMLGGVPVVLSGWAWLSGNGMEGLGSCSTERPVVTREEPFNATIVLPLTDQQLAVIEQRRAGSDIRVQLDANVVLGYDPKAAAGSDNDRWPERSFQESIHIYKDVWGRFLSQISVATSLAVVARSARRQYRSPSRRASARSHSQGQQWGIRRCGDRGPQGNRRYGRPGSQLGD